MAVFSLPYGGQRHKASGEYQAAQLSPPSPSLRQRGSSSKQRRPFKQLATASASKRDSVWEYFAPLNPQRSPTLLTAARQKGKDDEMNSWLYELHSLSSSLSLCLIRRLSLIGCLPFLSSVLDHWFLLKKHSCCIYHSNMCVFIWNIMHFHTCSKCVQT